MRYGYPWQRRLLMADGGNDGGGDAGGGGDSGADPNADGGGEQPGNTSDESITFPNASAFQTRMEREARSLMLKQAKDLGFNTIDEMQAAVKTMREQADKEKTDLERLTGQVQTLTEERDGAIAKANAAVLNATAQSVAAELGVSGKRISAVLRLADLNEVEVPDDGKIDTEQVKAAIEAVLADYPELKGGGATRSSGEFGPNNGPDVTLDQFKEMGYRERVKLHKEHPEIYAELNKQVLKE